VIITPDNEWYGNYGGVAYVWSFTWTGDTPCWVFSDRLSDSSRYIGEACSHEVGHTVGLRHDGRTSPSESYYRGHGSGETGWAPIMGVGYYELLVQWSKGEYAYANNKEDDTAIITTQNGFGYRMDDHGNAGASATVLNPDAGGSVSANGVIETRTDVDVFSFATAGGLVSLAVSGGSPAPNLDILIEMRDAGGALVASDNPEDRISATLSVEVPTGGYTLHVSGTGKGDPLSTGYSDYGSLGQFTLSGTVP
jgi:hypothetical protein